MFNNFGKFIKDTSIGQKLDFELEVKGKPSILTLHFIGILLSISQRYKDKISEIKYSTPR